MIKLTRVFTGAALDDGSKQLSVRVENSNGLTFDICSGIYLPPKYLIDGTINFFRKRPKSKEELNYLCSVRTAFEVFYDRIENIVRVSEGYIEPITLGWLMSIIELDNKGEIKKKGSWITLRSILAAAGQNNEICTKIKGSRSLYDFFKQYCLVHESMPVTREKYMSIARTLMRMEHYHHVILKEQDYTLDIDCITSKHLDQIKAYFKEEGNLSSKYPKEYSSFNKVIERSIPTCHPYRPINKSDNYVVMVMIMLKKVFKYLLYEERETANDPFYHYEIGSRDDNPMPIYFTTHELNLIRKVDLSEEPLLSVQRDILLFHVLTGCRYRDMMKLSDANHEDGELVYEPEVNVKENFPAEPVISLVKEAEELIEQYDGADIHFRLFPFVSKVYYEELCSEILKRAGIDRIVFVHDPKQRKKVARPLCEVFDARVPVTTYRLMNHKDEEPAVVSKTESATDNHKVQQSSRVINDDVLRAAISLIE